MTTVLLTRLWIHDAANLANNVAVFVLDEGEERSSYAEVREYAGGRQRAVSRPGAPRSVPLALRSVDRESYARICELIDDGRLVLVRLPRGRKLWGIITSISETEHRRVNRAEQVTMTVQEVSFDERAST